MNHFLSIVVPVFNRTWQLRRALSSLVNQTYKNFEVVICDDGSTENVATVIDEFCSKLSIVFVRIDNSGGPARPRNVATAKTRGEWICFLDSDDWWDVQRLAVIVAELNNDIDLLYHPLRLISSDFRKVRRGLKSTVGSPIKGSPLRYMALFGNPIPNSAAVVRKSILEEIGGISEDPSLIAYEDFDTWLRLAEFGARIKFIDSTLGSYWIGDDAISKISEKQIHRQKALFDKHSSHFVSFEKKAFARQNYTLGLMWSRIQGQSDMAKYHLGLAKNLPSLAMKLNRFLNYIKIQFWPL